MGVRGNMWIKDSQGNSVQGGSRISGREDSIEVLSMKHKITIPADMHTGRLSGNRTHKPITVYKKIDNSTPFLNKACCSGECFQDVTISLYHISDHGREEEYFRYTLSNVRVMAIQPMIGGTEDDYAPDKEKVAFIYEKIEWHHLEGNYAFTDSWNERG